MTRDTDRTAQWRYVEPNADWTPREVTITEDQILTIFWHYWVGEMRRAGKLPMVTEQNCIEDFVVVNWAWRV